MGLADLHIHTMYSWDGTCSVSAVLKRAAEFTDLNVVAITDHDEIEGALEAMELAPSYGIEVVPGCEISTADGHVLALFSHTRIPRGLSLVETVLRVGAQGGLCIAAHPTARGSFSIQADVLLKALQDPDVSRILVGIETFNAGLVNGRSNLGAQELAQELPLSPVGGSDAHLLWMVGLAAAQFPGTTAADLRLALEARTTQTAVHHAASLLRLASGWLSHFLLRRVGWVTWTEGPESPLRLARIPRIRLADYHPL